MENLLVQVLGRFTERLTFRQRQLYEADTSFIEKWREAMRYLVEEDIAYQKVWLELQALSWNHPELRAEVARVNASWRAVLMQAFKDPHERYGLTMPLEALVSLVMTFNEGIMLERAQGISEGHRELLSWIDGWLTGREDE